MGPLKKAQGELNQSFCLHVPLLPEGIELISSRRFSKKDHWKAGGSPVLAESASLTLDFEVSQL